MLAQLRHHGDWDPDPNSTVQMLRCLASRSSLAVSFDLKEVDPNETTLAPYPFLYLTGFRDPGLTDEQVRRCAGTCRRAASCLSTTAPATTPSTAPRACWRPPVQDQAGPVPGGDDLFRRCTRCRPAWTRSQANPLGKDRQTDEERAGRAGGHQIKNRLVLVYSKNDLVTQLKQVSDPFGNGYDADTCRRMIVNVVAYAMQN